MFEEFKQYLLSIVKNKQRLIFTLLLMLLFISTPTPVFYKLKPIPKEAKAISNIDMYVPNIDKYPINTSGIQMDNISAKSAIIVDLNSKAIIYSKNPNQRLYPASTTKMVTALTAIKKYNLEDIITIKNPQRIGQVMFLLEDEQISIHNLLRGALIYSANDAAEILAEIYPQGRSTFITEMNQTIKEMGLKDTNYKNPIGLDQEGHYSTVHDLAIIATNLLQNSELKKIVNTKSIIVTDKSGKIQHLLENTNQLLGNIEGVKGIKTGWTESAGECLITYVERDKGNIIIAILGSYDRFGETTQLINWTYNNHTWINPNNI